LSVLKGDIMRATSRSSHGYDAIVVGARCAGAATSMLLARAGMRVLALERSGYGSDTLSTHALMRSGVVQLARWGLLPALEAAHTPAVRKTVFHYGSETIAIDVQSKHGVDALYAPRRTLLDRVLVDAARESGAEIRHGVQVSDLIRDARGRVRGVTTVDANGRGSSIAAEIVIGADGVKSTVARLAGAALLRRGEHAAATVYAYFSGLAQDAYHWHFAPSGAAGLIPTNDGRSCVFVGVSPERFARELRRDLAAGHARTLVEVAPELVRMIAKARLESRFHGFAGMRGFLRTGFGPGWALVGDAGYFKDPGTAHGISDALRDAELLARAVAAGGEHALVEYQAQRDALSLGLFAVTDELASFPAEVPRLKALHRTLNEEMAREARLLSELATPSRAA
jgi:flavin-dependent dehydrogenase